MKPEEAIHRTAIDVLEAAKVWSDDQSIKNKVHLDCRVIEWKEYGYPHLADEAKATLAAVDEAMKECDDCMWIEECDDGERYVAEEGRTCNDAMRSIRRARKGERQANPNDCEKFITMAQVVAEGRLVAQVREECHGTGWYRCKECVHYEKGE